jgi:hypothetical protein
MSSALFRLTTGEAIIDKVSFLNAKTKTVNYHIQGLLVMSLDDTQGEPVDDKVSNLMVIFNTSTEVKQFNYAKIKGYQLHPIQKNGVDEVVKQAKVTATAFSVPPLSSAVFVKY